MESSDEQKTHSWSETAWEILLYDIADKRCIPFVGPGASERWVQLDATAKEWAEKFQYPYPLEDSSQLPRVSQFLAIREGDESTPKKLLSRRIKDLKSRPMFSAPEYENTVYAVLADLNLPIYVTTNYDHLMEDALTDKGKKPIMEYSIWKDLGVNRNTVGQIESSHTSSGYFDSDTPQRRPTSAEPLVFHLLGDIDTPQSMVLTEKDYIDFAIYLSKMGDRYTLPHSIRQNLSNSTLLFVGYRLEDIRFIIVFEGFIKLMSSLQSKSIAVQVQLPSKIESESQKKIIQEYLEKFTESYFKIDIYWGDSESFFQQLRNRLAKGGQ
jgi:hypothetical protein